MSEQKLVSPLLDGFQMGDPISSHDGVRCCPAIRENSDHKYIIKILSIPASQSQLEALLLTGAFQDAAGALNYFKELADGVVREAQLHQQLARLDGFVPCEAWQVVPMDDNQLGYDVYLLTPYRRTLERYLKKNTMTHLEAVNLGLDICAALAASRRAGHLYVDLKPSNIFMSDDREYLIGDLGFISMDSIKYAALPSKYRSRYSAPELHDIFATISDTADIYALGLILYQVYNDGTLPFDAQPPAEILDPPANADYEMAEIILKACHPDPAQRWQDPTAMGQALVAYMQRNTINDVPIMPPVIDTPAEEPAEEPAPAPEDTAEEMPAAADPAEEAPAADAEAEAPAEVSSEDATAEAEEDNAPAEEPGPEASDAQEPAEAESAEEESPEEAPAEAETDAQEAAEEDSVAEDAPAEEDTAEEVPDEAASDVQEPADTAESGENAPASHDQVAEELAEVYDMISSEENNEGEEMSTPDDTPVSDDISDILAQADELVAHEIPDPVVVPEPKLPEEEPAAEACAPAEETVPAGDDSEDDEGEEDEIDIPIAIPSMEPVKKTGKRLLIFLLVIALAAGLAYGGNYYYQNYYLIPVESVVLDGSTDQITAQVTAAIDESMLTAVCTDTYGNTTTSQVQNGQAVFTGLNPGTQYTVSLKVEGFHKLSGNHSASFTTTRQTNIVSISATTGAEDGSVILSFTVDGTDPENWTVEYVTDGQEPQTMSFAGHMVTINGLTVDAAYTFRLMPTEQTDVEVVGTDSLDFTVSRVILAENVVISSFNNDLMDIRWTAPEGAQVEEWTIRCTDGGSFDQALTVSDCTASFSGVEAGKTYSLEILAHGMTQSARAEVTPKLLTVTGIDCTPVGSTLRVTWEYEGDAPADGWTVSYAMNGGEAKTMTTQTNAADLSPMIPGSTYTVTVAGVETSYEVPAAGRFSAHGVSASDLQYSTCVTPDDSGWNYKDVKQYTYNFSAGQSVSLVVYCKANMKADDAQTQILYVIRDAQGNLLPELTAAQTMNWKDMWTERYFYPTVPNTPDEAGEYTVEIYFDGALAINKRFFIK